MMAREEQTSTTYADVFVKKLLHRLYACVEITVQCGVCMCTKHSMSRTVRLANIAWREFSVPLTKE